MAKHVGQKGHCCASLLHHVSSVKALLLKYRVKLPTSVWKVTEAIADAFGSYDAASTMPHVLGSWQGGWIKGEGEVEVSKQTLVTSVMM